MGRYFPPVHPGPGTHSASCTMGTGSFPGVKYGRGVLLTTHPLLVSWSWKSRAIPLANLWATTGSVTGTLYLYYLSNACFSLHGSTSLLKASMLPVLCQAPHSMSHTFVFTQLIIFAPISAEGEQAKTASTSSEI